MWYGGLARGASCWYAIKVRPGKEKKFLELMMAAVGKDNGGGQLAGKPLDGPALAAAAAAAEAEATTAGAGGRRGGGGGHRDLEGWLPAKSVTQAKKRLNSGTGREEIYFGSTAVRYGGGGTVLLRCVLDNSLYAVIAACPYFLGFAHTRPTTFSFVTQWTDAGAVHAWGSGRKGVPTAGPGATVKPHVSLPLPASPAFLSSLRDWEADPEVRSEAEMVVAAFGEEQPLGILLRRVSTYGIGQQDWVRWGSGVELSSAGGRWLWSCVGCCL